MNKPKLDLQVNVPANIILMQEQPATGSNAYGQWYLFNVLYNDEEHSFFTTETVARFVAENGIKKGDELKITKTYGKVGKKNVTDYTIELVKKAVINGNGNGNAAVNNNGAHVDDYDLMHESLTQAKNLQSEFGALVEFSKVAISLFISKKKNGNSLHY